MKKNISFLSIVFTLVAFSLINATNVSADSGQYGQYGGTTPTLSILIDKTVAKPGGGVQTKGGIATYEYVDNLSPADVRFKPGNQVMFKLKVKNTSNTSISNVTVKDFIPVYLEPIEGPGTYDSNSRVITFDAGSFAADEEKTYLLKMQLNTQDKMPSDKGLFCLTNKAQAYNGNVSDDDTTQFCIEKEVINTVETPKAGPEMGLFMMLGELGLLGMGLKLTLTRRK